MAYPMLHLFVLRLEIFLSLYFCLVCLTNTFLPYPLTDWYLGQNVSSSEEGIFPKSYVRIRGCVSGDIQGNGVKMSNGGRSTSSSSSEDKMSEEIQWTLHRWRPLWRDLFAAGKTSGKFLYCTRTCTYVHVFTFALSLSQSLSKSKS